MKPDTGAILETKLDRSRWAIDEAWLSGRALCLMSSRGDGMSAKRVMIVGLTLLSAAGCSHPLGQPTQQLVSASASVNDEAVDDAVDDAPPRRRARTRVAARQTSGVDPLAVLQASQASRAGWKTAAPNYEKAKPPEPSRLPDPRTTASVGEKNVPKVEPNEDAQAVIRRLKEDPGKNSSGKEPTQSRPGC